MIQKLVLFAVVHPGQHCPPQTFLLWGQQNRVSSRVLRGGLFPEPTTGRAWGNAAGWADCPPYLRRLHGPGAGTLGSRRSNIES